MPDHELAMCAYVQLGMLSDRRQQALARDRFLLLGGVEACRAGWPEVAEACRKLIVASNAAHQLNRHATLADALRAADFQHLVAAGERYCSYEQAEHLLRQLGLTPEGDEPEIPRGERMIQLLAQDRRE